MAKAMAPFRIMGGVIGGVFGMLRDKPDVVVRLGGYPSIPAAGPRHGCAAKQHDP